MNKQTYNYLILITNNAYKKGLDTTNSDYIPKYLQIDVRIRNKASC